MAAPREIIPGRTYLVTRRCTQRRFLLRPDPRTNAAIEYCLAEALHRFGIVLIAAGMMSNHYHAVVHDPRGRLPEFLEHFHKMLAKVLNARWGRSENLWSSHQTSVVHLATPEDVFDKVVYTLANPVAAYLVDRVNDWPGLSGFARHGAVPKVVPRPRDFFRVDGTMAPVAELAFVLPEEVAFHSKETWSARVIAALADVEETTRAKRLANATPLLGRKRVLRLSPTESPTTTPPRSRIKPTVACRDLETLKRLIQRRTRFRTAYASARERYSRGEHQVVFPYGTWLLRKLGVTCEPEGPSSLGLN